MRALAFTAFLGLLTACESTTVAMTLELDSSCGIDVIDCLDALLVAVEGKTASSVCLTGSALAAALERGDVEISTVEVDDNTRVRAVGFSCTEDGIPCNDGTQMFVSIVGLDRETADLAVPIRSCAPCTACGQPPDECGDQIKSINEACDDDDFGSVTCSDFGFTGGMLTCQSDCQVIGTQLCTGGVRAYCGDRNVNALEGCDNGAFNPGLGGSSCASLGLGAGDLNCEAATCTFDWSDCAATIPASCTGSDGTCEPCDLYGAAVDPDCAIACGADGNCADRWDARFGTWTCRRLGLRDPDCGSCGDGTLQTRDEFAGNLTLYVAGEMCDGSTSNPIYSCESFGLKGKAAGQLLQCGAGCAIDPTSCDAPTCGDFEVEGLEQCENTIAFPSCTERGYNGGAPTCWISSCTVDCTGCTPDGNRDCLPGPIGGG